MRLSFLLLAFIALTAFESQPMDERAMQNALPQSHDAMWTTLTKTKIKVDKEEGLYSATYPPEVNALVGKQITISGFMLPLESTPEFKHFILSKRTPTCAFCPPGEPNEIVDVIMEKPVAWDENLVRVTGTFTLMNDREMGMFFKLTKARLAHTK